MKRRDFLKTLSTGVVVIAATPYVLANNYYELCEEEKRLLTAIPDIDGKKIHQWVLF